MNLSTWLERAAHLHPEAPALLQGTSVVADYAEFYRRSRAIAGALRTKYGIAAGDSVAIFMHNATEYLEAIYATLLLGAAIVPINVKLHPREAAWIVQDSASGLIVSSGEERVGLLSQREAAAIPMIDAAGSGWKALYDTSPIEGPVRRGRDDVAWIFYTSGTTGRPKGVMQTHGNLQATSLSYLADVDAAERSDCALYAAPMSHGAGSYNFVFTLRAARHAVPASGGFDPAEIQELAAKLRNVCMFAAPTMVRRMVSHARGTGFDGDGLKTVVYGGGPMYVADILEAVDVFGPRFVQIYGQAESPMTITALSRSRVADRDHPRWRERLGSVGAPHACVEVKIADPEGNEMPRGQIGEILVSGSAVMAGYWRNERATADAIRDGWLWTGDLGSMDDDGFVTLRDRSKDMIISGGSNIYPREVEEVLLAHPSVAQVSVVGQPDREWGEVVIAFVVLEPGHLEDSDALDRHCIANIARFKRPKRYLYLSDLPKNAYGKVLKTELRKLVEQRQPLEA
ncbi:MAG: AMP-binding protein [Mesorhizobium sp.]|nr:AMP-binding protein [Mesorhizobium sp.]MCO5162496.1 AMP-binding protein [Mesorhizobium sp.]